MTIKSLFHSVQEYQCPVNISNTFFFNKTFHRLQKLILEKLFFHHDITELIGHFINNIWALGEYYDRHSCFISWISTTHPHADFHAFIHAASFYLCPINIFIKIQCDPQLCYHHSPIPTFPKELVPIASSIPIILHYVSTVFQSFAVVLFLLYLLYVLQHKFKFFHFIESGLHSFTYSEIQMLLI